MKNGGKLEEEAWKWSLERCKSRADGWVALNGVMIFFFSMLRNCYATLDNGQCSVCLRNINLKIKSCFTLFLAHEIHVTRPCRHHKLHVHVFAVTNMWMRQVSPNLPLTRSSEPSNAHERAQQRACKYKAPHTYLGV